MSYQATFCCLMVQSAEFGLIGVWNRDLRDSGYLWIDLFETELPGRVLGAGEAIENSNLLATFKNVKNQTSSLIFRVQN